VIPNSLAATVGFATESQVILGTLNLCVASTRGHRRSFAPVFGATNITALRFNESTSDLVFVFPQSYDFQYMDLWWSTKFSCFVCMLLSVHILDFKSDSLWPPVIYPLLTAVLFLYSNIAGQGCLHSVLWLRLTSNLLQFFWRILLTFPQPG
jgi:hypothetical protein